MADKNVVQVGKNVAKSVMDKAPKLRKATITNVDNSDYLMDVDLKLPVGTVMLKDKSIITPYAGDGYGFICSSRENQSVIVAPVDGDYDRGIILGRIFDSDIEKIPRHNLGDTLFRHQLGSQWSFAFTQPITGAMNLDASNVIILTLDTSNDKELKFKIALESGEKLLPDQLIRVVLNFKSDEAKSNYLTAYVEWEDRIKFEGNDAYIIINDTNTVVGGPLYQTSESQNSKSYKTSAYNGKFYAMLLSPNKGIAQFSHYTGMGLYMDEYPNRVPMGRDPATGWPLVDNNGNLKSFSLNNDAFLNDTVDQNGQLQNFSRGSLILKHYSDSGLYMVEKVRKTYSDLKDDDNDPWYQSAMGVNLVLIRPTPNFKSIRGLDDDERPMASLVMEDDCKHALNNSIHIRLGQDSTGVQAVTTEEIAQFSIVHRDPDGTNDTLENPLPGTRPSRLQFYDLKRKLNDSEIDTIKCIHDNSGKCRLNQINNQDVPAAEQQATYGSGKEDIKTGAHKCPNWPGCSEGHFTHSKLDIPLSVRDQDIWINNMPLLIKPKANLELAHYTGSGLFIEEQLPEDENGEIIYDDWKIEEVKKSVANYHAPNITLRLREWNHMPFSDKSDKIDYNSSTKTNAFEPKLYDSCILEFDTIYGDRRSIDGTKGSYSFKPNGAVEFKDLSTEYRSANKILLAQKLYGNKLTPEDKDVQLGNRLVFSDLLDETDPLNPIVPADIWIKSETANDSKLEGSVTDSRLIFPKGKLELMHYTNSGLIIQEKALEDKVHKMAMSLQFNYWNENQNGDDIYRAVDPITDKIDPMGIIKWHETGTLDPSVATYDADATSFVDFFIYQNAARAQHITKDPTGVITWWDNKTDGGDPEINPTGAFIAIRESDNSANDSAPRAPVVEISDTKNSIRMDSGKDKEKIEIMSRKTQFTNDAADVNKILMDSMNSIMQFINGYEGMAAVDNNSITMDKAKKSIVIVDANGNTVTINDKGITIEDKVNKNIITMDSKGILIEDTNSNKITMASAGIKTEDKNGNIIDMTSSGTKIEDSNGNKVEMAGGGIKVEAAANVEVKGVSVKVEGAQVTITGGTLTTNGVAAPTGSGPYCGIPACLFTSAPHVGSMVSGT
jgi:hypothetical protein